MYWNTSSVNARGTHIINYTHKCTQAHHVGEWVSSDRHQILLVFSVRLCMSLPASTATHTQERRWCICPRSHELKPFCWPPGVTFVRATSGIPLASLVGWELLPYSPDGEHRWSDLCQKPSLRVFFFQVNVEIPIYKAVHIMNNVSESYEIVVYRIMQLHSMYHLHSIHQQGGTMAQSHAAAWNITSFLAPACHRWSLDGVRLSWLGRSSMI